MILKIYVILNLEDLMTLFLDLEVKYFLVFIIVGAVVRIKNPENLYINILIITILFLLEKRINIHGIGSFHVKMTPLIFFVD